MRVVLLSKAMTVAVTHSKAELLGKHCDLTLLLPEHWPGYVPEALPAPTGFHIETLPIVLSGKNHFHFYLGLRSALTRLRPDILHIDEEPYSFVTTQAVLASRGLGIRTLATTYQNILRRYPQPFRAMEQLVYRRCPFIIAGIQDAKQVLRRKGYAGCVPVITQFGVVPEQFSRAHSSPSTFGIDTATLSVAYVGRLVPEKAIDTVLRALVKLDDVNFYIVGTGLKESALRALATELDIADRVHFVGALSSTEVAKFMASVDVLVLPSITTRTWKEQFGRVLIEAMASGAIPVGSSSGEIPNVIGDGGLVFPEGDSVALAQALDSLKNETFRKVLEQKAALRVQQFTQERVANDTLDVYREFMRVAV